MQNQAAHEKLPFYDKRITQRLVDHWREARESKKYPSKHDINSELFEDILGNCFILKTKGVEEGKYDYAYIGENIIKIYGCDSTKRKDYEKGNPLTKKHKIEKVIASGHAEMEQGEYTNIFGDLLKYRLCLLPLSSDGVNIDSILGGISYTIEKKK